MEVRAYLKFARISPIKARFLLGGVKKMTPVVAAERLALTQQRSAKILRQVILDAIANAKNNLQLSEDSLQFSTLRVDEGPFLKRFRAGSKGSGKPYLRRTSHIEVVLVSKAEPAQKVKKVVAVKKTLPTKTPTQSIPSLKTTKVGSGSMATKKVTSERKVSAKRRTVVK